MNPFVRAPLTSLACTALAAVVLLACGGDDTGSANSPLVPGPTAPSGTSGNGPGTAVPGAGGTDSGTPSAPGVPGTPGAPGTGGSTATPGTGTTPTPGAGGTAGATPTPGAGGTATAPTTPAVPQKLCATQQVLTTPLLADFETYDGLTAPDLYAFPFNGGITAYSGFFGFSDGTGTFSFLYVAGNGVSNFAPAISNPMASSWGGGLGAWMTCVDASSYAGIRFFARGTSGDSSGSLTIVTEDLTLPDAVDPRMGGTCAPTAAVECAPRVTPCSNPSATFPLALDWAMVELPWSAFMGCSADGVPIIPTGSQVAGLSYGVNIAYGPDPADDPLNPVLPYVPVAGPIELAVDDISFY